MFHIVEITSPGTALAVREGGLLVQEKEAEEFFFPLAELAAVLVSQPAVSLSGYVLAELAALQIPLIFCTGNMQPAGILLSCLSTSAESSLLLDKQLHLVSSGFSRRIWQKIISGKISGQANVLQKWRNDTTLFPYARQVKRGDSSCLEGVTSALYWRKLDLFPRRDRLAKDANILFNYTYTILYSVFAREIVTAGLFPKLGIHHHHRDNPFPLASDLMEPFRPCMDMLILDYLKNDSWDGTLGTAVKNNLMKRIYCNRILCQSAKLTLFSAVRKSVQSYKKALLLRDIKLLELPDWPENISDVVDRCV